VRFATMSATRRQCAGVRPAPPCAPRMGLPVRSPQSNGSRGHSAHGSFSCRCGRRFAIGPSANFVVCSGLKDPFSDVAMFRGYLIQPLRFRMRQNALGASTASADEARRSAHRQNLPPGRRTRLCATDRRSDGQCSAIPPLSAPASPPVRRRCRPSGRRFRASARAPRSGPRRIRASGTRSKSADHSARLPRDPTGGRRP
jgi:hypothetical protein